MLKLRIQLTTIIISFIFSIHAFSQKGYEIKIKIEALKDSTIILGHYEAKAAYPNDTIKLDKKGAGIFKRNTTLKQGMYFIFMQKRNIFNIMIGENQKFSIIADTSDFIKTVKFTGSSENQLFYEYQKQNIEKHSQVAKLIDIRKKSSAEHEKDSINKILDSIDKEMLSYIKKIITDNPNLMFTAFLTSLQEINVPDFPRNAEGGIIDSSFQRNYYRKHYFDNFRYDDPRLYRTPVYEDKVTSYMEKIVPQIPDTLIKELDVMIDKVHSDSTLFRYLLGTFFNYYGSSQYMGMDAVFVHLAEKYYIPYATWSKKEYITSLKKDIAKVKPNLIGNQAPNVNLIELDTDHFLVAKTDTAIKSNPFVGTQIDINGIKAKFLVIVFWEADCGHCKKAMPLLYDSIYPRIKELGAKVLAVHTFSGIPGKRKWIDFVNEHNMYDWINAWSPYSFDYKDLYNAFLTPTVYLLDENKKIVAKNIGVSQIEGIINEINYLKKKTESKH